MNADTRVLIFAAGRGQRMKPLSDRTPKPLLRAGGRALIEWQIDGLARAGWREIIVNTAHLPQQIEDALGDGRRYGVRLAYSREGETVDGALETAGGIVQALPLLGAAPFIAISGDIVTDYDYALLAPRLAQIESGVADAHLVLVDNPPFNPGGDMGLADGLISLAAPRSAYLTYANIGVFAPRIFSGERAVKKKLFPWLYQFVDKGRVTGEKHAGRWHNVGTPADLAELDALLKSAPLR